MAELAGRKIIEVAGLEVTIKEITVGEARALLLDTEEPDPFGDNLFADMRLRDLTLFTSLKPAQIEGLLPSQVEEVITACRGMNRPFFAMTDRISEQLRKR